MTQLPIKILFIDDDELILNAFRRALRQDGYELHFTTDPETAFRLVKELGIDIVVADHTMPEMTGIEFFAILRRLHEGVRRVMITGQGGRDITIEAINTARVERFLEKPWKNNDLRDVLRALESDIRARRRAGLAQKEPVRAGSIMKDATGAVVLQETIRAE